MANGKYQDMGMNQSANPMPKAPMHTNQGKDPGVKRLEKHGIKSGFFTKKPGMKGYPRIADCPDSQPLPWR